CLQLQGKQGVLAATDGGQLLWQGGFSFPWSESLLIPASRIFASPELCEAATVQVGHDGDWIFLVAGAWTISLHVVKDARYPNVEQVIPTEPPVTTLHIPNSDRDFLSETIPGLPSGEDHHDPVTLDLNGEIALRATGPNQSAPTELVLSNSRFEGAPM